MKRIKMFEDNWIDNEIEDTNRRMSELDRKDDYHIGSQEKKKFIPGYIDPSRVDKLVHFLDSLDDEAKVSAGDILGYIMGWVDKTSPPEDEIEVF